jgi:hypothetical protein
LGEWRVWSLRGEGSDYFDHDLDGKGSLPPPFV